MCLCSNKFNYSPEFEKFTIRLKTKFVCIVHQSFFFTDGVARLHKHLCLPVLNVIRLTGDICNYVSLKIVNIHLNLRALVGVSRPRSVKECLKTTNLPSYFIITTTQN